MAFNVVLNSNTLNKVLNNLTIRWTYYTVVYYTVQENLFLVFLIILDENNILTLFLNITITLLEVVLLVHIIYDKTWPNDDLTFLTWDVRVEPITYKRLEQSWRNNKVLDLFDVIDTVSTEVIDWIIRNVLFNVKTERLILYLNGWISMVEVLTITVKIPNGLT